MRIGSEGEGRGFDDNFSVFHNRLARFRAADSTIQYSPISHDDSREKVPAEHDGVDSPVGADCIICQRRPFGGGVVSTSKCNADQFR